MGSPTTSRSQARQHAREKRRGELLGAAVEAVERHGAGVSMEQIAAQGGVTKPILYRHFGDRAGLADAIARQYTEGLIDRILTVLRESPRSEALWATVDAFLSMLEDNRDIYQFIIHRPMRPGDTPPRTKVIDVIAGAIADVLADQLARDGQSTEGAETMAYGIVGMVHYAADHWIETGARHAGSWVLEVYPAG
jgi:AcrR family transcriptional regulator